MGAALSPWWLDKVFAEHCGEHSVRRLLFSTAVELSTEVAFGLSKSIYQAACRRDLGVSYSALYQRLRTVDEILLRRMVRESAERLYEILPEGYRRPTQELPGYRLRIVDGNHLHRTDKRLAVLRKERGAARPGYGIVVFCPATGLITDFIPSPDAHRHETRTALELWQNAEPGELWIADRAYCTREIIAILSSRTSHFILREAKSYPKPVPLNEPELIGRTQSGTLYEQRVRVKTGRAKWVELRRVEIRLDTPAENGETVIRLLTNLPIAHASAEQVANLYRSRWRIENAFQRLEAAVQAEVKTLGHPNAALLAMAIALIGFNALTVVEAHIELQHAERLNKKSLSLYYIAAELAATAGALILLEDNDWLPLETAKPAALRALLARLAKQTRVDGLTKHVRSKTDPRRKKEQVPRTAVTSSVATKRLLDNA